jgi:SAM-dependent methyltransferase
MSNMLTELCPICNSMLVAGFRSWHLLCNSCGYEKSSLQQAINENKAHLLIDEDARAKGLRKLRLGNFHKILESIKKMHPGGKDLLEVGSAHGWFLEQARKDFDVVGLEPDENFFQLTNRRNLPVRRGLFPDALKEGERFDIIVFNDVLEHIPEVEHTLACCYRHLNADGLLVINLPSSNGVFYRISKVLCRLGWSSFFERLWQKDLPSPHVHYFSSSNLSILLGKNGFKVRAKGRLSTLRLDGLYTRISYTGNRNTGVSFLLYMVVASILPILKVLPSDIEYIVSSKCHNEVTAER